MTSTGNESHYSKHGNVDTENQACVTCVSWDK